MIVRLPYFKSYDIRGTVPDQINAEVVYRTARAVAAWNEAEEVVVGRVPSSGSHAAYLTQVIRDKLIDHRRYIRQYGEDMPDIHNWGANETGKKGSPRK
jgi:phosphoketolase